MTLTAQQARLLAFLEALRFSGPGPHFVASYEHSSWQLFAGQPKETEYDWQEAPPFSEADLLALREAGHLWVVAVGSNATVYLGFLQAPPTSELSWDALHPALRAHAKAAFETRQYDIAVFNALKAVESALRARIGGPPDLVGRDLVATALNPKGPRLVVSGVASEQEGAHALFRGAVGLLKNPHSHRFTVSTAQDAIEVVHLASLLLRLVDRAELAP